MYFILSRINTRLKLDMENPLSNRFYTLAEKFQIKENTRALLMARRMVMCSVFYAIISTTLFTLFNFKMIPIQLAILTHVLENAICLNPLLTCPVLMSCSTIWHDSFWSFLPTKYPQKVANTAQKQNEMEIYFSQLKNAWI